MIIFNNIGVNKLKMKKTYNFNVLKEKMSSIERNQNKLLEQMVELNSSIKEQEELIRLLIANKFLDSISNKVVTKQEEKKIIEKPKVTTVGALLRDDIYNKQNTYLSETIQKVMQETIKNFIK